MMAEENTMKGFFQTYQGPNSIIKMHHMLVENIASLREEVLKGDWKQVKIASASCLGLATGAKRLLENEVDSVVERQNSIRKVSEKIDMILRDGLLSEDNDLKDIVFSSIENGLAPHKEKLTEFKTNFQKFKNGDTNDLPITKLAINDKLVSKESVQFTLVREVAIACASRGLIGLMHADFNMTLESGKKVVAELSEDFDAKSDVNSIYIEYSKSLDGLIQQLYVAMTNPNPKKTSHKPLIELLDFIERRLPAFARAQAWMYTLALKLKNSGKGGAAEEIGKIAAKAGHITRESIAAHVSCLRILLELSSIKSTDKVDELFSRSSSIPFDRKVPNAKDVELSLLKQSKEGDFVEISGFVVGHEALRTQDNKLISRLTILDPSSGISAKAVAIFTHLAHMGVTIGSYCRINGVYRENSIFLEGESGLEIDRLSLSELEKSSWYLSFLGLSERWYQAWRNGTNMKWGLGPQFVIGDINGELDEKASSFGAGELIFPPFVRDN